MAEKKAKKEVVKRAPVTKKEVAFVEELLGNGGNATKAALKVYDVQDGKNPYMTAAAIASQNLSRLKIPELEQSGFTLTHIAKRIFQGSNAKRRLTKAELQMQGLSQMLNPKEGGIDYLDDSDADWQTRLNSIEIGLKLSGLLTPDKAGDTTINNNFAIGWAAPTDQA